jgi:histidinol-phosphate aminotransferase
MSPTPVTFASPTQPASWSWEATNAEIAARYGLPLESVVRFDTNTAPAPPELVGRLLAAADWEVPLSEYPPSDYGRLIEAAAARYGVGRDELLVGAGADEILELVTKAFVPPGGSAIVPVPTYPMYGIVTEQRTGRVTRVPRRSAAEGYAIDVDAVRAAAAEPDDAGSLPSVVWLCSPNNPTGRAEPPGTMEGLLTGLAADAERTGRAAPYVILDEAYIEFSGDSLAPLRTKYPHLVVVRTMSKAYAIAGLRVGFAVAAPEVIRAISVYRPPGSVTNISVDVAAALLGDPGIAPARVAEVSAERERFRAGLRDAGWAPEPSSTNFLLVDFATPAAAGAAAEGLLSRGLVPRTFPASHPLAHCLRLTVRSATENDRLLASARDLAAKPLSGPA